MGRAFFLCVAGTLLGMLTPGCLLCTAENPDLCLELFNTCGEDKGVPIATSLVDLDLRQQFVWTTEAPVGNMIADAIYAMARRHCGTATRPCPDAAVENAGAIRYETPCGERELITAGQLYESDILQMLPFASNRMDVIELTGHDLKLALEHSVDLLGQRRASEQGGHFLHVSRLRFEVDCDQPSQAHDPARKTIVVPGARIVDGSLMIRTDPGAPEDLAIWEPVVTDRTSIYRIATNSFIGSGNDGFLALVAREQTAEGETALEGDSPVCDGSFLCKNLYYVEEDGVFANDALAVVSYLRQQGEVAPYIDGRIFQSPSCIIGSRR
ncbi:MAG: 5'-nucleotidase [Pseudomonadota bacterium]